MASSSTLILAIGHLLFLCTHGFTTDLIPIDSPLSPFYNPSATHYDRLQSSILRSFNRFKHFKTNAETPLMPGGGQYQMKLSLGTPPVDILGIVSTANELSWTDCLPCTQCLNQVGRLPLFDPSRSLSYKNISCGSDSCNALYKHSCTKDSTCEYEVDYASSSFVAGDLATETVIIGGGSIKNQSLPNFVFGCGHSSRGLFPRLTNGVIGLGPGNLSLVSQMVGADGKKFSYCLSQRNTSKISFGSDAVVSGPGVVTTPFIVRKEPGEENFYYLTLEAFSVGSRRIEFVAQKDDTRKNEDEGNMIIDSGTFLTFVPPSVLDDLVLALKKAINREDVKDPQGQSRLCYKFDYRKKGPQFNITVTAHFKGADVLLLPPNLFASSGEDTLCLAVASSPEFSIFGSLAQKNFLVGYDLDARVMSFKPTYYCTTDNQ